MIAKQCLPWSIIILLLISALSAILMPSGHLVSAFQSPPAIYNEVRILPTPRPPAILSSNDVTLGSPTLTTNLNGYWQLNETDTGSRFDSSPNGNNILTNINGVTWSAGREGIASDFEQDNGQYLKIESYEAVGLNFYHSFTIMGWLKRESLDATMILAGKYDFGANQRAYRLEVTPWNRLGIVVSPDGATFDPSIYTSGSTNLTSTTVWYHVAGVFDAGAQRLKVYVNGELDADKQVTYNTVFQSTAPFLLGANLDNGQPTQLFDGQLDAWRVYNRALSQREIQTAMGGLKGYWSLDETGSGPRADSSSFGNSLTNIGGVAAVPGQVGNAADFENSSGPAQYLMIDDSQISGLGFSDSFSLVGWLKREDLGRFMIIAGKYDFGINQRAYRLELTGGDKVRLTVSPDGSSYTSAIYATGPTVLNSTTAWYHLAAVFDAGAKRLKIYINGNLDKSKAVTHDTVFQSTAPFILGGNLDNGQIVQTFDGQLDDWRAYDRVLSQNEIQSLMNGQ